MNYLIAILSIVAAYLFGSVPVGYLMARLWGVDLLKSGSGKTGGTNVLRSAGLLPAALTILGDAFKGLIPTYFAVMLFGHSMPLVPALAGAAAVLGHNKSVFLKFRGGVGAITFFGALAALSFPGMLVTITMALIVLLITRFASMGSLTGSITGLLTLIGSALLGYTPMAYTLFGVLSVLWVVIALQPNFKRIKAGTERKIGVPEKQVTKLKDEGGRMTDEG